MLTTCECDVLQLAARGLTVTEIAAERIRSARTIQHQLDAVRDKLGATSIANAVWLAMRAGQIA